MANVDFSKLGVMHPKECAINLDRIKKIPLLDNKTSQTADFMQYLATNAGGLGLGSGKWKEPEKFLAGLSDLCLSVLEELSPDQLKAFVTPLAKAVGGLVKAGVPESTFVKLKAVAKSKIELAKSGGGESKPKAPAPSRGETPSKGGVWQWQNEKKWETYGSEVQSKLLAAQKAGESFVKFVHGGTTYMANLKLLQQENMTTSMTRQIRFLADGEDGSRGEGGGGAKAREGGERGGGEGRGGEGRGGGGEMESKKKDSIYTKWTDTKFLTETGSLEEPEVEIEEEPDPYEGQEGRWQWQAEDGHWKDYSDFVQSLIERSRFLKSTKVIFDRPSVFVTVEVFWREGFQRNTLTGQCRDVRLNTSPSSSSSSSSSSSTKKKGSFKPRSPISLPSPVSDSASSPSLIPTSSSSKASKSPMPELSLESGEKRTLTRGEKLTLSARGEEGGKKRGADLTAFGFSPPKRPAVPVRSSPRKTS